MVITTNTELIQTKEEYSQFKETLPLDTQIRFISTTSLMWTYGVVTIPFNIIEDTIVLVLYKLSKSHTKIKRQQVSENPFNTAYRGAASETGIDILEAHQIGSIFYSDNSENENEDFPKYTYVSTNFRGKLKEEEDIISEKILEVVRVKRNILPLIFEEKEKVEGIEKDHPQKYAYERFLAEYPLASFEHERVERW